MSKPPIPLTPDQIRGLARFTPYIWWKSSEETLEFPDRLIAQVMDRGSYEDMCRLTDLVGKKILLEVLQRAEVGQFTARSWHYWHYKLTGIKLGEVPPMPVRRYHD